MRKLAIALVAALCATAAWAAPQVDSGGSAAPSSSSTGDNTEETYSPDEIVAAAGDFFGGTSEGVAKVIEKVFKEQGRPVAYIIGEEAGGAITVGLRYGKGSLRYKNGSSLPVFWQGPSVGWDIGGNASKVFTLVYKLRRTDDLFRRYAGVDGSLYFVAGVGVNYQRNGDITLAPIRTGVGFRAGANIGYLHYTRKQTWNPL